MPIYEFRCVECGNIQETIVTGSSQEVVMQCKQCQGEEFERVLSQVSYTMASGSSGGAASGPSCQNRTCGPGKSCSTLTLPGHER